MQENRHRILSVAGHLFRQRGFDAVTVADVMKAAGLTHGGFYGHFKSKDDLIAQTVLHSLESKKVDASKSFAASVSAYLSPSHRDNPADGCPTACLAGDIQRQSADARTAMTAGIRSQIDYISHKLARERQGDQKCEAIGTWAAMVGAIILSRAVNDRDFSDEILEKTKEFLLNVNGDINVLHST
nr:TetR/AcrR family transcriptional regulator [Acetobacter indonesiensis]